MSSKIIQISAVPFQPYTNRPDYIIFGLTEDGVVVASTGDGKWASLGPHVTKSHEPSLPQKKEKN